MVLLHGWPGDRTDYEADPAEQYNAPAQARSIVGLIEELELIDGRPDAVRAYLRHFWSHWSGPP